MRAQILKIAGVKSEKDFYKKFPTEEAFMKRHGKAFKKAQMGAYIGGEKTVSPKMVNFNQYYDQIDQGVTGSTNLQRQQLDYQQQMLSAEQAQAGQNKGGGLSDLMSMAGNIAGGMSGNGNVTGSTSSGPLTMEGLEMYNGGYIPKAQWGVNQTNQWNTPQQTQIQTTPIQTQMGGLQSIQGIKDQGMNTTMAGTGQPLAANTTIKGAGIMNAISDYAGPAGKLIEGFQALAAEKEELRGANQWKDVSGIALQASRTRPEQTERRYTRPEDIQNTGEEFFPIYGVGTNVLAKDGAKLQGGGKIPWGPIGQVGSGIGNAITGNNAGGQIGGTLGGTVGSIFGPAGEAIGSTIGTLAGGFLDKNPKRIKRAQDQTNNNIQAMAAGAMGQGLQQQYQGYMESGGNIRQNNMEELQVYEGEAEQISTNPYLPDGGETVMFRGPSHAKGGMDISYGNSPVEVEGGEPAVKLQGGDQQENLVVYGNLQIPKGMLKDPDAKGKKFKNYVNLLSKKEEGQNKLVDKTSENLEYFDPITTFDKIKLASYKANLMGANMKLKDLAEKKIDAAALQNAINDTAKEHGIIAEDLAKGKYKADKKAMKEKAQWGKNLTPYFDNLLPEQTHPIYPGEFTAAEEDEPKFKKPGKKRVPGGSVTGINAGSINYKDIGMAEPSYWKTEEAYNNEWIPLVDKMFADPVKTKDFISRIENYSGDDFADVRAALAKGKTYEEKISIAQRLAKDKKIGPYHELVKGSADVPVVDPEVTPINKDTKTWNADGATDTSVKQKPLEMVEPNKRSLLMDMYNQVLPFLRPTDQEPLDPNQLAGEMYSMMSNQLEPVQAQSYQPQLDVPYDISFQDIRNENQADYRGAQRMVGNNPGAQSSLAGQKYLANQKVGAEEFRMNQAKKDQVYSGNRATMNDAQLKNLAIYDQQYQRQAQAKSNTKANTLTALNSMSDKYQKNKLENRQLGIYENMYNFRYDSKGRAVNMNGLQQFYPDGSNSTQGMSDAEELFLLSEKEDAIKERIKEKKAAEKKAKLGKRNGAMIKAFKNL